MRYHVFVSSTYSDLQDERETLFRALERFGYVPIGMECFPASSDDALTYIKRVIDECDYFVLIIGTEYGSTLPPRKSGSLSYNEQDVGRSFTELEYRYARETLKKPVLAFLKRESEGAQHQASQPGKNKERLQQFREYARERICESWADKHELALEVIQSLQFLAQTHPAVGWIRGPRFTRKIKITGNSIRSNDPRIIDVRRLPAAYPLQLDWPTLGKGVEIIAQQIKSIQSTEFGAVVGVNYCGMMIASFLSGHCDKEHSLGRPIIAITSSSERHSGERRDWTDLPLLERDDQLDSVLVVDGEFKSGKSIQSVIQQVEARMLAPNGKIYFAVLAVCGIKDEKDQNECISIGDFRSLSKYKDKMPEDVPLPDFFAYITEGRVEAPGEIR